ncbi:arginyl-tRNA-protein transferase [Stieleria bergensis]|uniref:Arginyl-tRNA-protein transferase n=1 Tax=Stieleria bergensis TaxID=2528025 RepID=A0A517SVY9_9BACT|nr:arginyl-tRNA-protein transferase [Planctomycetes bacterium SV_7m_r]
MRPPTDTADDPIDALLHSEASTADQLMPCPYLDDQLACLPLRLPRGSLSGVDVDLLLATGFRRSGLFWYRTRCPACNQCVPVRVPVHTMRPSRSQRRVVKRAQVDLKRQVEVPRSDAVRLELFNRHRLERGLGERALSMQDYEEFLVHSSAVSLELSFWLGQRLVAVSIADLGEQSISAVYTYFAPSYSKYSLGTLAVLQLADLAASCQRELLYLGYYVRANPHLNYKARFKPQQCLRDGQWQDHQESALL